MRVMSGGSELDMSTVGAAQFTAMEAATAEAMEAATRRRPASSVGRSGAVGALKRTGHADA